MKTTVRKQLLAALCAVTLLLTAALPGAAAPAPAPASASGWFESISAKLDGLTDADVTAVRYDGAMTGALTGEDFAWLVRDVPGGVRVDIPGLKAGEYTLTVTAAGQDYVFDHLTVQAHDRSGFAHKYHDETGAIQPYTEGVGAYYDDGTLKENATVLYVTDANRETVTLTAGGVTVTGIGNILNSSGKEYEPGTGQTKKGGKANTNADVLKKLGEEGHPLVVRFIGTVTRPEGVSAFASVDYGGGLQDNGGVAGIREINNVTLEGIGDDAVIDGWGFSYVTLTGGVEKGLGRNFEVRNLSFRNVPEDCIGINGSAGSDGFADPVEHAWVHNCAFYVPHIENPAEDDKSQGDGALDFKVGRYMTSSYNYFEGYHKTSLFGGGDSHRQYHITWHHNWYKNCESRCPLARQANAHIYNNLYDGQSFYCMSLRANCFIFSEYNTFLYCQNPAIDEGTGGVAKSYRDVFVGCWGKSDAVKVKTRAETLESANPYANFDVDPAMSYIPGGDYLLDEDTEVAVAKVRAFAGPTKPAGTQTALDAAGSVSRQQLADTLARLAGRMGLDTAADPAVLADFIDGAAVEDWAAGSVAWCVQAGIIKGRGNGVLDPTVTVTAAEAAVMIQRLTALLG